MKTYKNKLSHRIYVFVTTIFNLILRGISLHIPDGWIDPAFLIITWLVSIIIISISLYKMRDIDETRLAYMAVLGGTIFAAQMLNFPIVGGTSGHLLGGVLAAGIVGPWGAVLVITVVLLIQALAFGDGGIIALGANIYNLAIISVFTGYIILRLVIRNRTPDQNRIQFFTGVFLGAFFSVVIASICAAIEIGIPILNSTTNVSFTIALPTILFYHILIGIGEGVITMAIVYYFYSIDMNVFLEIENPTFEFSEKGRT